MKFIEPNFILQLVEQPMVSTDVAELLVSGVCFKCMKEVGVQAEAIIVLLGQSASISLPSVMVDVSLSTSDIHLEDNLSFFLAWLEYGTVNLDNKVRVHGRFHFRTIANSLRDPHQALSRGT